MQPMRGRTGGCPRVTTGSVIGCSARQVSAQLPLVPAASTLRQQGGSECPSLFVPSGPARPPVRTFPRNRAAASPVSGLQVGGSPVCWSAIRRELAVTSRSREAARGCRVSARTAVRTTRTTSSSWRPAPRASLVSAPKRYEVTPATQAHLRHGGTRPCSVIAGAACAEVMMPRSVAAAQDHQAARVAGPPASAGGLVVRTAVLPLTTASAPAAVRETET